MNIGTLQWTQRSSQDQIQPHQEVLVALYGQGHYRVSSKLWNFTVDQNQPELPQPAYSFIGLFENPSTSALGHDCGTWSFWQQQQIHFEFHRRILKIRGISSHFWQNIRNWQKLFSPDGFVDMEYRLKSSPTARKHFATKSRPSCTKQWNWT